MDYIVYGFPNTATIFRDKDKFCDVNSIGFPTYRGWGSRKRWRITPDIDVAESYIDRLVNRHGIDISDLKNDDEFYYVSIAVQLDYEVGYVKIY